MIPSALQLGESFWSAVLRKCNKFAGVDLPNMPPQPIDSTQRFHPFLVSLGGVVDAEEALGRLTFLGDRFLIEELDIKCALKGVHDFSCLCVKPPVNAVDVHAGSMAWFRSESWWSGGRLRGSCGVLYPGSLPNCWLNWLVSAC